MQNIKAIIFDLGGVILDIDFNKTNNAFSNLGLERFDELYSPQNADTLFKQLEKGEITEENFYHLFRKSTNTSLNDEQIKKAWNALLLSFRKEALNTLSAIKSKFKLYLLSNTNSIHHTAFNKIYNQEIGPGSLNDYFDKVYYSHEIGFRKPDKESYEYVLKENNLCAKETLFIDDFIQNIKGAAASGLQTILLQQGMTLEELTF